MASEAKPTSGAAGRAAAGYSAVIVSDSEATEKPQIRGPRRSPEIRKSTRGTRTPPSTVIARSPCDEAIQGPRAVAPGLLRCARNDGGVDATIIGHRLSQTTSCRDSIPVSRLFNALQAGKVSLPLFSGRRIRRWRRGQLRGEARASVGRRVAADGRDSFRVSRFINALQAGKFPSRFFRSAASIAGHAGGFGTRRFCPSERAVGRAPEYQM